jgi:hypothetical protein
MENMDHLGKILKIVLVAFGIATIIVLGMWHVWKQLYMCVKACQKAEKFILEADSNSEEDALEAYGLIVEANKFAFEKSTNNQIRNVFNLWKGKYYQYGIDNGLIQK